MNNDQINWKIIMYTLDMDSPECVQTYYKRQLNPRLEFKAFSQQYLKVYGWEEMGEVKVHWCRDIEEMGMSWKKDIVSTF